MPWDVMPVSVLADNYAWLVRDPQSGAVAVIDPGETVPVSAALNGRLDWIVLTHHHADHTGGVAGLVEQFGAKVAGPGSQAHRLPPLDAALEDGDRLPFGSDAFVAIATPGHADGHLSYVLNDTPAPFLFSGDALFSLGCGRLLEGTADELFASLHRYDDLPDTTFVCAGHEYTMSNARFALSVEPQNSALRVRAEAVLALRASGLPTLPVTLGEERRTNPFLKAPDSAAFAALRKAKDNV